MFLNNYSNSPALCSASKHLENIPHNNFTPQHSVVLQNIWKTSLDKTRMFTVTVGKALKHGPRYQRVTVKFLRSFYRYHADPYHGITCV